LVIGLPEVAGKEDGEVLEWPDCERRVDGSDGRRGGRR
jgi:hypothetical protein